MAEQLTFGTGSRRRRMGTCRTALERTLRSWSRDDVLAGDAFAVHRSALRHAADAVDAAAAAVTAARELGEHKGAHTLAVTSSTLAQLLEQLGPRAAAEGDELAALLASIGAAAVPDAD